MQIMDSTRQQWLLFPKTLLNSALNKYEPLNRSMRNIGPLESHHDGVIEVLVNYKFIKQEFLSENCVISSHRFHLIQVTHH